MSTQFGRFDADSQPEDETPNWEVTFCIMTLDKTMWLKRSVLSILEYCPTRYSIKILSQGEPDIELIEFLEKLDHKHIELIRSPVNLGFGGGRRLLSDLVTSPFTMMLDDDMYLTGRSIAPALRVFQENGNIGAVSMPQYDLQGRMVSPGGRNIIIRNGVIYRLNSRLNYEVDWTEANDLDAGAMLYRTEMRESFSWDPDAADFEDLDKSLQIISAGIWKQAIVPKGKLVHDRSWLGRNPKYERNRLDGLSWRRSYRFIRSKWGLRLDLRSHLLYEIVFPTLALTRSGRLVSAFNQFIQRRASKYSSTM